jgi:pimeloyl-ACP methyl ester carboxylesterase
MPTLASDHRMLAPDLLGHGESAKPLGDYSLGAYASGLRDLLRTLGIAPVTVVGQSLGGGVAMQLAYQHPELVERLVLVSSGGLGREVSWILRALTLPGAEYVMPLVFPGFVRDAGNIARRALERIGVHAPHLAELWQASPTNIGARARSLTGPRSRMCATTSVSSACRSSTWPDANAGPSDGVVGRSEAGVLA